MNKKLKLLLILVDKIIFISRNFIIFYFKISNKKISTVFFFWFYKVSIVKKLNKFIKSKTKILKKLIQFSSVEIYIFLNNYL